MSDAQFFVQQHLRAEVDLTKPGAYAFNYNNVGWAAQARKLHVEWRVGWGPALRPTLHAPARTKMAPPKRTPRTPPPRAQQLGDDARLQHP